MYSKLHKNEKIIVVLLFCMVMFGGCSVPDRALVLTGDGAAESAADGSGSSTTGSALDGTRQGGTAGNMAGGSGMADNAGQGSAADNAADNTGQGSTSGSMSDSIESSAAAQTILVYVCGAVANPGVVELPADSRAADALEAAGGLLASAQPDYVNLAARLEDAQKLYFPTSEEAQELAQEAAAAKGLVNINTAGLEELCTLPGIGEARAQDIITYREQHGAFQRAEDIMKVSGIKQNAYEKLKSQITVK